MPKVFTVELTEAVNLYYRDKLSLEQVAHRLGCSPGKVASTLKTAGYSLRTSSESQTLFHQQKTDFEESFESENVGNESKEEKSVKKFNPAKYHKYFICGQYEMFTRIASYSPRSAIEYLKVVNPKRIVREE